MLDQRKAAILKAIVREHVRTGDPVGSKTLGSRYRLRVSTATIRNDMALLDELGYIEQPYTSAGRVPTDLGYRWFVDNWPAPPWPPLPERQKRAIQELFSSPFGSMDEALEGTSHVLSDVTATTSVVLAPPEDKNLLRRIELLRRGPGKATLLLIADTGVVKQGLVEFARERSEDELEDLARSLNEELDGVAFEDLDSVFKSEEPSKQKTTKRPATAETVADRIKVGKEIERIMAPDKSDKVFRGGTAKMLDPEKFGDISIAHKLIETLEDPEILSNLLNAARQSKTILVFIGSELPIMQMQSCSVVLAPYSIGPSRMGTVGVVGPTRMDYPHTISAVEAVALSLQRLLGNS